MVESWAVKYERINGICVAAISRRVNLCNYDNYCQEEQKEERLRG